MKRYGSDFVDYHALFKTNICSTRTAESSQKRIDTDRPLSHLITVFVMFVVANIYVR